MDQSNDECTTLLVCIIETFTKGSDRRALALGILREIAPGRYSITPIYLHEINGAHIPWDRPAPGGSIATLVPMTTFEQACDVFSLWACQTFAAAILAEEHRLACA